MLKYSSNDASEVCESFRLVEKFLPPVTSLESKDVA